jgi:hypothetical protein
MARKRSRKGIIKEINRINALIVKERDNWTCQRCGIRVEGSNAHDAHLFAFGSGLAIHIDLLNQVLLCFHCHIDRGHRQGDMKEWFKEKFPARWEYLHESILDPKDNIMKMRRCIIIKFTDVELEKLLEKRKQKLEELKN